MNKHINSSFHIVMVDSNKEFNNKLTKLLQEEYYQLTQLFNIKHLIEIINNKDIKADLVILNINFESEETLKIIKLINNKSDTKVILLSGSDIASIQREEYFKQGILDYHLTVKKIDHIANDIKDTIVKVLANKKETILIIDHDKEYTLEIKKLLEKRSYNVLVAHNAKDCIEFLKEHEITLLLLDMELPDKSGLTILEGLKYLYLLNEFLVMAISNRDNPSLVRDALKGGASNFMKKPFLYEEFLLQTDILVEASRSRKTITKQKQQIEYSLQSFKELVDSSINMMFVFKKNICVDCNNEAADLLGYGDKKYLIGCSLKEIFNTVSAEHYEELLEDTSDHYFNDKIVSKNGNWYDVQIKERNIYIGGKLLKIVAAMDITDIKRNNKIISQQSKMASMGEMIGNIAHQWRQPLTAISVAASGIKLNYELEMEDRSETEKELDNIVQNTKFLSATIEDFQSYLKNDRTKSQFFMKGTITKTLAIIQANLESHEIDIIETYKQDSQIEGIQNDIVQILLNIVNNAVDKLKTLQGHEKRKILIDVSSDNDFSIVSVSDSGGGVPENIIEKIFDPYFTTKHQAQGTGLGLYMTHQIIEKIGGEIDVENSTFKLNAEEYYGARFILRIPLFFAN